MAFGKPRRPPRPLDPATLEELALRYVGKYATTRAKLSAYLRRKVRERGWDGAHQPDPEALANRFSQAGYIDDSAYALSKSRALTDRGYGKRRVADKLRLAGVGEDDGQAARQHAEEQALAAALRFAQRRKLGPFAAQPLDRPAREKAIAALVRAGHSFALARALAEMTPGADFNLDELRERARLDDV